MINKILIFFCILLAGCTYNDMEKIFKDRPDSYTKILGEIDYTKNQTEKAKHKIGVDFKKPIHETQDKKKLYYVGGSIYHNYDIFSRSYHVNGFGQLGMEF